MTKTCFQDAFLPSCFIILIFLQLLPTVVHGNGNVTFDVIGPNEPILAIVGKGADLPCHLSPNISAKDMELRWYRDKFSPAVYVYERGKNASGEQMEEYRGRTTFLIDHIANGTAAVRIHDVTVFDNGTYHCYFQEGTYHKEATLWLKVAGLGSQPRIRLRDDKDKGAQAECTSAGWYPRPRVKWRDFRGKVLPSVTNLSVSATSGLFAVISNVKITDRVTEGLFCFIVNPLLPEKKVAVIRLPGSISLDPDTANPKLELSKDLKSVSRLLYTQDLPDNPERFNEDPCVLGQERFTRGKHYWEVKVGNRKAWTLGVCLESLDRKGSIAMSPRHGLWAMEFCREELRALAIPRIHLHPSQPLQRVGIFLDYEAGNISFYNGADGSHVYTFSGVSFSGPLRPFFCLWLHDRSPLTICSGSRETGEVSGPLQVSELHQKASVTPVIERAASFSKDREPPLKRPMFSPQSSPVLWKKHPSLKSQLDDILV
ncbi:putative butyrophilin subfamily 2 member A3 [Elephas maximus indicus]|nr:putative butyrophilin subfamily 2 member A3 [Elephas maximus indicus]